MLRSVEQDGFAIARGVVAGAERLVLLSALGEPAGAGSRGLLAFPEVRAFACSEAMQSLVTSHLGRHARPVRAIFFDKSPQANWLVPWHQDVTIAVAARCDASGYGPWSMKNGIPHVQPPAALLAQMLAVRLHLDDCDAANGALRVIPGSHSRGRLTAEEIASLRATTPVVVCSASAGDALVMRPLLVHASSKSTSHRRRRILHIEYCSGELPAGMAWHDAA